VQQLLTLLIGGAAAGGLYAILASGIVLTYQTSGIFNFAHGAVAFVTALFFFELNIGLHWPVPIAAVVAILGFAPGFGWLLDRLVFRKLVSSSETAKLVVPIALLVALPAAALFVVDRINSWTPVKLPTADQFLVIPGLGPSPKKTWFINGVVIDSNQLIILGAAAVTALGLWLFLGHSRLGLQMRAVVDRRSLATLRGVDADRTSGVAWAIGGFLAGLAGVVLAPLFTLNPPTFTTVVLISTPAVVLARFRSLPIAMLGGLLLGVIQSLVVGYAGFAKSITGFRTAVPFILLYVLLFWFGNDRRRRAGTTNEEPLSTETGTVSPQRRAASWLIASALLLGFVFFIADGFWQTLVARGLALGVVLLSFTVVTGIGGMVSLAQATFVAAASFTAGFAMSHGWPFVLAVVLGAAVATVVGVVVSLPARRLGGLPLALSTMAIAFIGEYLVFQLSAVNNDGKGWAITPPTVGPIDFSDRKTMVVALMIILALTSLVVRNLLISSSGRAMMALRASEPGAVTVGVRSARTKFAVFAVSATIAGFGGVLLSSVTGRVGPFDYPVEIGLFWLAGVVVMGVRRPAGGVLAGLTQPASSEVMGWFTSGAVATLLPQALFGLAAASLARQPDGILGAIGEGRHQRQARRLARDMSAQAASPASGEIEVATDALVDVDPGAALQLRGVRAGYGEVEVLHGIDLVVPSGQALALVGANGAGKTTLAAVVAGLVAPTNGDVLVGGHDVTRRPPHRRVGGGVFLIPEGRGIFPALTVEENIRVWLDTDDDQARAFERFPALAERTEQLAGSLSGGEQQMLALAPALVRPPEVLVVDEPSLGLAPLVVDDVYQALGEIKAAGTSILLVEEKANDALRLADRVAFLEVGRLAWVAAAADVDEDRLVASYLGVTPPAAGRVLG
jgi:ABC-type branched-subunit amino acid transport system ATPase component/branched-subunit amino acid ABC-type transport system permease component